ncbi:baseplate hub protein [Paraburkholderia saeva]|uniref:baseplate hub protein n=1 Tax=Paraburkholderia saeva TaxID=2777537 RepID=UPI001D6BB5AF|nr:hypothetical protein [Paraburkholderia saeva]CAG4888012.1 hypothetical protein R52603_00556 [Paraburkholderia saeva]
MTFSRKKIDLTITLGTGQFGDSGSNTVTLTGLRVHTGIQAFGGDAMPQTQLRIFGLPLQMVNQLTGIGPINSAILGKNSVLVAAGDDETGMQTVFSGSIWQAWGEFQGMPDTPLNILGGGGIAASLKPVQALSYVGPTDVAQIMQTLAQTMGFAFENNGVSVQLSNPYLPGTALQQVRSLARAADISFAIDRDTLAIWPKRSTPNQPAARGGDVPLISPATGLVGYPTFASNGIGLTTLFNPQIKPGGVVQVESSLPVACGKWVVRQLQHSLQSETPNGQWFSQIMGVPLNAQ